MYRGADENTGFYVDDDEDEEHEEKRDEAKEHGETS